jgi:hypothetical protein
MFADFTCRYIIIIIIKHFSTSEIHISSPMEGISDEIIVRGRICQLFPLKSEDYTVGLIHFAEYF